MSVLFIDTDCELPYERAEEVGITNVIKMPYTICGKEYFYDLGKTYNAKEFFTLVRQGNMPITSGLNSEIYREYFEPFFKLGEDILYLSFSSQLSGTFKYLDIAIKDLSAQYPKAVFRRFDTKSISMGAGLPIYVAAKMHNEGKTNDEIIDFLTGFIKRVRCVFSPSDLFHLKRGGRISGASATFGTMLQIKPIIRVNTEGKLVNTAKIQGKNKMLNSLADEVIQNVRDIDKYPIVVMDADSKADSIKISDKIKASIPDADIWIYDIGPVIGTHCGADTIGIIYVSD
ncbi:MAG: DegV family protein [Clostridia bacterium]|nr:DegV family protein [Clostridia bacterium]